MNRHPSRIATSASSPSRVNRIAPPRLPDASPKIPADTSRLSSQLASRLPLNERPWRTRRATTTSSRVCACSPWRSCSWPACAARRRRRSRLPLNGVPSRTRRIARRRTLTWRRFSTAPVSTPGAGRCGSRKATTSRTTARRAAASTPRSARTAVPCWCVPAPSSRPPPLTTRRRQS